MKEICQNFLFIKDNKISKDIFRNIDDYLPPDSLLVFNNTRVIRARLLFRKETGAAIEVFVLNRFLLSDYELSFSSKEPVEWKCIVGNLKKWKSGIITTPYLYIRKTVINCTAEKLQQEGEAWRIRFSMELRGIKFW